MKVSFNWWIRGALLFFLVLNLRTVVRDDGWEHAIAISCASGALAGVVLLSEKLWRLRRFVAADRQRR